jgi:hypothetical protein
MSVELRKKKTAIPARSSRGIRKRRDLMNNECQLTGVTRSR